MRQGHGHQMAILAGTEHTGCVNPRPPLHTHTHAPVAVTLCFLRLTSSGLVDLCGGGRAGATAPAFSSITCACAGDQHDAE
jgi:hypothetical protein